MRPKSGVGPVASVITGFSGARLNSDQARQGKDLLAAGVPGAGKESKSRLR